MLAPLSLQHRVEQRQGQHHHGLQTSQCRPCSEHTASALEHQSLEEDEILGVRPLCAVTREDTGHLGGTGLWAEQQSPSSSLVPRSSP